MSSPTLIDKAMFWTAGQMRKRVPYSPDNQYLEPPYAPVREERTETGLRVSGTIPAELNGLFARNGPNPIAVDNPALYHWFTGDGMVHGVRLRDGEALWYRNRYVGSDRANVALGKPLAPGPRRGVNQAVNTNIVGHAGSLWALVEAGALPIAIDADLETRRHSFFSSDTVAYPFSPHPHRDPATGALHAVCYDATNQKSLTYVRIGRDGSLERALDIPVKDGPMVHDCAVTSRYVLVFDMPVTLSIASFFKGSSFPYRWNPQHAARVGLLPHDGTAKDIRWCDVDPCFVFHTANAVDQSDGSVVVDCVVHATMFDTSNQGPDSKKVTFERWTIDPARGSVTRRVLDETPQEFPRYDERRTGSDYRYAYTVGTEFGGKNGQPVYRHDLATGVMQAHHFGPRRVPAEAVFVPRLADGAEDDGWVVAFVYDLDSNTSDFVILNAADLDGEPQAIVHLPVPVPMGFHGNWIADEGR